MSGENLIDAQPSIQNQQNEPTVSFTLDRLGAQKFGRATTDNVGKRLAIVLDGKIISAPNINEPITSGNGMISGNFTFQEATDLALLLRSGALPTPLDVVEERTVGPDLGEDSIKSGIISLIVGFILVILFMFYKYKLIWISCKYCFNCKFINVSWSSNNFRSNFNITRYCRNNFNSWNGC